MRINTEEIDPVETFVDAVVSAVRSQLGYKRWYRGCCTNGLRDLYPNLGKAIDSAITETILYDGMYYHRPFSIRLRNKRKRVRNKKRAARARSAQFFRNDAATNKI